MSKGKCATKDTCVLIFRTFEVANCYLNFGVNTKFDYNIIDDSKVQLERKNMDFTIPLESFDKLFKIITN